MVHKIPPQFFHVGKIAIVLVGLPARGKSYISFKLCRYLQWLGLTAKAITLALYRKQIVGGRQMSTFFDPENKEASEQRRAAFESAMGDMEKFFEEDEGQVAVLDGTNVTKSIRKQIYDRLNEKNIQAVFIEVINDNPMLFYETLMEEVKTSPDYAGIDPIDAEADLRARIEHYTKVYETISEDEKYFSYIKMFNVSEKVVVHNCKGFIQVYAETRIVYFLMNVHIGYRNIFLCRDNQGEDGKLYIEDRTKPLSDAGKIYSEKVKELVLNEINAVDNMNFGQKNNNLLVWTSTRWRSKATALPLKGKCKFFELKALDDLNPGLTDGMTQEQIKERFPIEYEEHKKDVYSYRYPRGESYRDLVLRLEPIILEMERARGNVLIVAQDSVIKCLLAYIKDLPVEQIPDIEIPEYSIHQLLPRAFRTIEKNHIIKL